MRLDLLSTYRTQLMGVAILWVMLFHSTLSGQSPNIFTFLKGVGYGGVDIFMLLSGFGVYYAISKNESVIKFYKKRALRIFPYYLPIVLLFSVLANITGYWTITDTINNLLLTGYWLKRGLKHIFDWYVPALVFLYLITPVFYYFFKKNKVWTTFGFILFSLLLIYLTRETFFHLGLLTFRVPTYFLGFLLADFLRNHKDFKISSVFSVLLFIVLILGFILLYRFSAFGGDPYKRYFKLFVPFYLITFPLCLFLGYLFSLFKAYKFPVLTFFGTYTLVLYIFHERLLRIGEFLYESIVLKILMEKSPEGNHTSELHYTIFNIVIFFITIIMAVAWQKFIDKKVARYK